jgi:hypothetical protein
MKRYNFVRLPLQFKDFDGNWKLKVKGIRVMHPGVDAEKSGSSRPSQAGELGRGQSVEAERRVQLGRNTPPLPGSLLHSMEEREF